MSYDYRQADRGQSSQRQTKCRAEVDAWTFQVEPQRLSSWVCPADVLILTKLNDIARVLADDGASEPCRGRRVSGGAAGVIAHLRDSVANVSDDRFDPRHSAKLESAGRYER